MTNNSKRKIFDELLLYEPRMKNFQMGGVSGLSVSYLKGSPFDYDNRICLDTFIYVLSV